MFIAFDNSSAPVTFSEAWDLAWNNYLQFIKYPKKVQWRYGKHLEPTIGHLALSSITPFTVEQLKNHLLGTGLKPQTVMSIIGLMRRVFNLLSQWGLYDRVNPVSKVKLPTEDDRRTRCLSPFEARELLANLKERSEITWQMALVSLTTGLRPKEIFKLKGEHIDLRNRTLHVVVSKNGRTRTVYLPDVTADMLSKKILKPGRLVFTYSENTQINSISVTFKKVVTKMGLNDGVSEFNDRIVFYSLRHTYASWMAQDGQPMALLSELMGHSNIQMTMRYIHLNPDRKKAATATIDKIFENIHEFGLPRKENMQIYV